MHDSEYNEEGYEFEVFEAHSSLKITLCFVRKTCCQIMLGLLNVKTGAKKKRILLRFCFVFVCLF